MSNLPPPTAIVTGASRGIGRAAALRLARDGFAVVVNYAGNREKAAEVVAEITGHGGRAIAAQADVANAIDVGRLFDEAERAQGPIGVVVNSAGIMKLFSIAAGSVEDFDAVFAVKCAALSTFCSRRPSASPTAAALSHCPPAFSG